VLLHVLPRFQLFKPKPSLPDRWQIIRLNLFFLGISVGSWLLPDVESELYCCQNHRDERSRKTLMTDREQAYQRLNAAVSRLESAVNQLPNREKDSAEADAKVAELTNERDQLQTQNGKLSVTLDRVEDRLGQAIFRLGRAMEDS